jgi:hypothetical protein
MIGRLLLYLSARAKAKTLLAGVEPPTPDEIARFVPEKFRNLGPDWVFTRGKLLVTTETRHHRIVGSLAGFDVAKPFREEYSLYHGAYGYYDHRGRLHVRRLKPSENDRSFREGRPFIILFDRRSPGRHHLFTFQRPQA